MEHSKAKQLMDSNPGYYKSLIENFKSYPNPCFSQIDLDIRRTFPHLKSIDSKDKEKQMANVLYSYAKRNPTIGYWQGLNFVVAMLLHVLDEEEAFWILCQLIETILPMDYYTIMTGILIDYRWLVSFLEEKQKGISKHLKKWDFDLQAIICQWIVCLYANTLSFDIVAYVWDDFFEHGIVAIFRYGLAIFDLMKKELMKSKDMGDLFWLFREFPSKITSWKVLSDAAKKYKLTQASVEIKRRYFTEIVYKEYEELHRKKDADVSLRNSIEGLKTKFLKKFHLFEGLMKTRGEGNKGSLENFEEEVVSLNEWDTDWPICLYDFLYKDKIKDHFTFRSQEINIVDDYFGDGKGGKSKVVPNNEEQFSNNDIIFEELLIERNRHICECDNLEEKFKVLFGKKINEFFLSVIHLVADDPFDELIDNNEKIEGFLEIWSELVDRHNLNLMYSGRKAVYQKGPKESPNFFDEFVKMEEINENDYSEDSKIIEKSLSTGKGGKNQRNISSSYRVQNLLDASKKRLMGLSISKKMRSFRRSQSVKENDSVAEFIVKSDYNDIYALPGSNDKRLNSFKRNQHRKIMSLAQFTRIEERFNFNKRKRKQIQEQREAKTKANIGLDVDKIKIESENMMLENWK